MSTGRLVLMPQAPTLRLILRRSKEEGQENSIDVQRAVNMRFADTLLEKFGAAWAAVEEYIDDGISGGDFEGRKELHRLLAEVRPGDIVICLDSSRFGRDMLVGPLTIRDLVNEKRARFFYAANGKEITSKNALETFMTVVEQFGDQQEKERNQQRTRATLREKVKKKLVAGGRRYGLKNIQHPVFDSAGRMIQANTEAVVDEEQARIIRRMAGELLEGAGYTRIAKGLNRDGIPSPSAGKRGTGSWSPSAVREILRRELYRGVYVHGQTDRVRKGGKRISRPADPEQVLRVEVPEWRILDEETWQAVQAEIARRASRAPASPGPASKYPLSGLAKCGTCGGSICLGHKRLGETTVRSYTCSYHWKRGAAVCPVRVSQPRAEVETALANHIQREVLPTLLDMLLEEIHAEADRQLASEPPAADTIEADLRRLRAEQKRYAATVLEAPDVPELLAEMRKRSEHIRRLEADLAIAKRAPAIRADTLTQVEEAARAKIATLSEALAAGDREAFRMVFPEGLVFLPAEVGRRRVWRIRGTAKVGPTCVATPAGFEPVHRSSRFAKLPIQRTHR